jgi:hypothetical protein
MEVQVNWESSEIYKPEPNLKLKDFLNNWTASISNQLVEQDYILKFNNNPLSKILVNNQIKDLISKFHGHRIDISPSAQSLEEIHSLLKSSEEKRNKMININKEKADLESAYLIKLDFKAVEKKMEKLIKPLNDDNTYFTKVKEKILKNLILYETLFKDKNTSSLDMIKVKISENIGYYNKIINHCFKEVLDFVYKYGVFFLNQRKFLELFSAIFTKVFKSFLKKLNSSIKFSPSFEKFLNERQEEYKYLFDMLEENILEYRMTRYVYGEPPSTVFFSFDEPVKVNISEMEYNEIKELLGQFPTLPYLKQVYPNLTEEQFKEKVFALVLERDLRVYQNYGIKMEDFIYGILLYEN